MIVVELRLPDDQMELLGKIVAAEVIAQTATASGQKVITKPVSIAVMAKLLDLSPLTVRRRIKAGTIKTIPGINPPRIPAVEANRLLEGHDE